MRLEQRGLPTVLLATDAFLPMVANVSESSGMPDANVVTIAHPLGGIGTDAVSAKIAGVVDRVIELLTQPV